MNIKIKYLIVPLFVLLQIIFVGCSTNSHNMQNTTTSERDDGYKGEIILVLTSQACRCTLERCADRKQEVIDVIESLSQEEKSKIKVTEYDYSQDREKAADVLDKYKAGFVPSVIVLDNKGIVLYKKPYGFDKEAFTDAVNGIVRDIKGQK